MPLSPHRQLVSGVKAAGREGMVPVTAAERSSELGSAALAHLSRYCGTFRIRTESDLRVLFTWCRDWQLAPLAAQPNDLELCSDCWPAATPARGRRPEDLPGPVFPGARSRRTPPSGLGIAHTAVEISSGKRVSSDRAACATPSSTKNVTAALSPAKPRTNGTSTSTIAST